MIKYEKFCLCTCPKCGTNEKEWIEIPPNTSVFFAYVYCRQCKKIYSMKCIELESNYLW